MNYARRFARRAASRKHRRQTTKDQTRRGLMAERLEERSLLAGDLTAFHSDYWNSTKPTDVNADGMVSPNDALAIINRINAFGSHSLTQGAGGEGESGGKMMYVDVNNDGFLSPVDALAVINRLNAEGQAPPLAKYTVQTIDAAGNPISSISQGQDFYLQFIGQDLRPTGLTNPDGTPRLRGVNFAYADIIFDKSFANVAVSEVQTISITGPTTGSFTLTLNPGQTTASINYDDTSAAARTATAAAIQTALNTTLGAGTVTVNSFGAAAYKVTFSGPSVLNVDEPTLQASANATVAETVKGDPTVLASFATAATFNNHIVIDTHTVDPNTGDEIFKTYAYDSQQQPSAASTINSNAPNT